MVVEIEVISREKREDGTLNLVIELDGERICYMGAPDLDGDELQAWIDESASRNDNKAYDIELQTQMAQAMAMLTPEQKREVEAVWNRAKGGGV